MTNKLRDALHQYEQIGPAKMDRAALGIIRDAAAKASLLAHENGQLVADYGERGDVIAECRVRVSALEALLTEAERDSADASYAFEQLRERTSALEALLAECEAMLGAIRPGPFLHLVTLRAAGALLAKLKARTKEK